MQRVCNTHINNWIPSAGLYNGFLHISTQEYQVETLDICKCLERQLLFNCKNILESLWHNSGTAGGRLTNLSFVEENFDRWQFLSIGIYRLEKLLFSSAENQIWMQEKVSISYQWGSIGFDKHFYQHGWQKDPSPSHLLIIRCVITASSLLILYLLRLVSQDAKSWTLGQPSRLSGELQLPVVHMSGYTIYCWAINSIEVQYNSIY